MKYQRPGLAGRLALAIALCAFAGPMLWMLTSSLKSGEQVRRDPFSLLPPPLPDQEPSRWWSPAARDWRFDNYTQAVSRMNYGRNLNNTLWLCAGSVVGTLVSCSLVAYGFARLRWRGRNVVFGVLLATMLLPWQVTMIPRFLLLRELGLYNSLAALIVPTFLGDAFYIFLLRQFFLTIPQELSEAARLDGCSEFGVFWRIVIPLAKPALVTVALFQFIASWNDFNGPLLYLSDPEKFPLAYGLEQFVSAYSTDVHLLLAAAVLFTLPIVVLFLVAQRSFVEGISTTGLKG